MYPIASKFKYKSFVVKHIIYGYAGVLVISCLLSFALQRKSSSNLCSPFIDFGKSSLLTIVNICNISFSVGAIIFMSVVYTGLVKHLESSKHYLEMKESSYSTKYISIKLSVLICSNFIFWVTSSIIYISANLSYDQSKDLTIWNQIVISSLPAIFNPIYFAISFIQNIWKTYI